MGRKQPGGQSLREQPRLVALLFADWFNRTDEGKYNLSGIFVRIRTSPTNPHTPRFALYMRLENVDPTVPIHLKVIGPNGDVGIDGTVVPSAAELAAVEPIRDEVAELQAAAWLQFIPPIAGQYWFEISYRGEVLGGAMLSIDFHDLEKGDPDGSDSGD